MFYIGEKLENNEAPNVEWRVLFIRVLLVVIFGFIAINLFNLQISEGEENLIRARNVSQHEEIIRAQRGVIYDSNGELLARNVPAYRVSVVVLELSGDDEKVVFNRLGKIIGEDPNVLHETYRSKAFDEEGNSTGLARVTLSTDIDYDKFLAVLVKSEELPGVYVDENPRRSYPYGPTFAHILGYVGDISEKEVEESGLDQNASIGKEGVEKSFDEDLRGIDGRQLEMVDTFLEQERVRYSETPINGNNLFLTLDASWQKKLESLLVDRVKDVNAFAGVVIIMENETGDVKAMVNYPSYDNNLFVKGISGEDFARLNSDESTPLINRAIALQLPTGSVFKPMVAATALQEGVITSRSQYKSGCVELPLYKLCEADHAYLGTMTVVEGLGKSSNVFFCKVALDIVEKADGIRSLMKYTDQFGIGKKTGIDLPGEQAGTMATPEFKQERQGEPWYLADICNTAIGQGLVTATPIQMVLLANTIANDGKVMKPNLVSRIETQGGEVVYQSEPEVVRTVSVDRQHFQTIKKGMNYAVNGSGGSAWLLRGASGDPYAKTGSADAVEYRKGRKIDGAHSWALGGFEYEGKGYSFVVHMQEGGRGWQSVPVIRGFLDWLN